MTVPLPRRLLAEFLGTALLVTAVVGSGIMATKPVGGGDDRVEVGAGPWRITLTAGCSWCVLPGASLSKDSGHAPSATVG
jgi:glycerol uptake facilitator-like aquaporin